MDIKTFCSNDNFEKLFDPNPHDGEYFLDGAYYGYSELMKKDIFTWKWVYENLPSGRYVNIVYQRHSLYLNGELAFVNPKFDEEHSDHRRYKDTPFSLILNKPQAYYIDTWKGNLISNTVNWEDAPLITKSLTLEDAKKEAEEWVARGYDVLIVSAYGFYDMY